MSTALAAVLGAVTAAAALLVVPPWMLLRYVGNPWPAEGISLTAPLTDDAIVGLLAACVWVLWAQLTVCIASEAIAVLTDDRIRIRVPFTLGVQQQLARRLVTAAVAVAVTSSVSLTGAAAAATPPDTMGMSTPLAASTLQTRTPRPAIESPMNAPGFSTARPGHGNAAHAPSEVHQVNHPAGQISTVTVMRLDSLWSIAERTLGDGDRWTEIAALNEGHRMNDGTVFASADNIRPGWRLIIPPTEDGTRTSQASRGAHDVVVREGDTLSAIALSRLGDAELYPEIYRASRNITQPDGRRLTDPNVIDVGWTLRVPTLRELGRPAQNQTAPTQPPRVTDRGTGRTNVPTTEDPPESTPPESSRPEPIGTADVSHRTEARGNDANEAGDRTVTGHTAPWVLTGLTGGGAVLAWSMMMMLRRKRRMQFRYRRPGLTIAAPGPALAPVEKTVMHSGSTAAVTLEFMDEVLRRLGGAAATSHSTMPEVAAVQLGDSGLVLHLSAPADLHAPWRGSQDRMHWTIKSDVDRDDIGPATPDQPAPYPLLVTIGADDDEQTWLLNFEDLVVSIIGDTTHADNFARYIAAELACNPWSSAVTVDCVGVGEQVSPMNPDRIRVENRSDPAADVLADAVRVVDLSRDAGVDVSSARVRQAGDESWPARMLLIDAEMAETAALAQLLELVLKHAGHTATAVVINGQRVGTPGVAMHVSSAGRVTMPEVGLDLIAVGLTSDEARGCAALLAHSDILTDEPIPVGDSTEQGWRSLSNQAGALRSEHTLPRDTDVTELEEPATSLLGDADEVYVSVAATTPDDLQALAPMVPASMRARVEDTDPHLDDDVQAWFSSDCSLPRLTLMGPVTARTRGAAISNRKPYWTEILAFLATRRHGATPEELAATFDITTMKAREYARIVRGWLGTNPRTGQPHLPDARKAPSAKLRGVGVYEIVDLLIDVDLFRRLRVRGEARGADGIEDLQTALRLVTGRPFTQLRPSGWSWLFENDRLDLHIISAIIDVAHMVTTHALHSGALREARLAAETAMMAAPDDEIALLGLASVSEAEGHLAEAEGILRNDVCNRTDDDGPPLDLSQRTQQILARHNWLTPGRSKLAG